MISIGIRVTPKKVCYSIIQNENDEINLLTCSHIVVPKALYFPMQLSYIRTNLLSIIMEYNATNAGIRITESISMNVSIERINIEGVIQELLSNCTIEKYFAGTKTKIASLFKEDVTSISAYFDGNKTFREISNWNSYNKEEKESIITSIAASYL